MSNNGTVKATIQLRRDNDFNFSKVKDKFVPAYGEVVLVDTVQDGLRAKVGDGVSTYAELNYVDEDIRNVVQQGYYENGIFYRDPTLQTIAPMMINKIYIDKVHSAIYYYNGEQYIPISQSGVSTASSVTPGVMKLYSTTGQNIDGTMTQKSITDELDLRFKTDVDAENELLVFSL